MKIKTTENTIIVISEYNTEFVDAARNLGGKWVSPAWVFDIRDEAAVRAACMEFYGTDGVKTDTVDIRVTITSDIEARTADITVFGKVVARAFGRDSGAKIGAGIVIESGKFSSGGSAKNWETTGQAGTVFLMRDVSRRLVEANSDSSIEIEILSAKAEIDKDALQAERDRLMTRLAEIDEQLELA
jgi:hypothetical protein